MNIIPNTNDVEVAMIAAVMFIVEKSLPKTSSELHQDTAEWTKRFTETYQALSKTIKEARPSARSGSR